MSGHRRLHIGGTERGEGWEVLNAIAADYVDHHGNARDLSRFPDATFDALYASHVLEHFDFKGEIAAVLREWHRVLKPGGKLYASVPDLEVLCRLFLEKGSLGLAERFQVMCMMFGGHVDQYDYHAAGLDQDLLASFLGQAGFVNLQRVPEFGFFRDTSTLRFRGVPISVNVVGEKPLV